MIFSGNTAGAEVYIDDLVPFTLGESVYGDERTGEMVERKDLDHYQITPGKHLVIVKRDDKVVVKREILLGNGMTKEIQIP